MDASRHGGHDEVIVTELSRAWRIDAASGALIATIELPEAPSSVSLGDIDRQVIVRGRLIVSDYQNGAAYLTDIDRPQAPLLVDSTLADNYRLAVDFAQRRLVASGRDGLALVSLRGDGLISRAFEIGRSGDLQISNDGSLVSRLDLIGGAAEIWDISGGEPRMVPLAGGSRRRVAGLTRDDHIGSTLTEGLGVQIIDLPSGTVRTTLQGWPVENWLMSFDVSADGRLAAFASRFGLVQVRSMKDGAVRFEMKELELGTSGASNTAMRLLDFDSAGKHLVGTTADGHAVVWDLTTGKGTMLANGSPDFVQARYTPDGRQLATLGADGTVTMRDAATYQPNGRRFVGNTSTVNADWGPYFSPDGRFMATTFDFLPKLWDMQSGQQIGSGFPSDAVYATSVSRNMRWAVTGRDGRVVRWDLDVDRWPEIACRSAGRNMTLAEWEQYGPTAEYHASCPQFADPSTSERKVR